jgi:hypothetical protein
MSQLLQTGCKMGKQPEGHGRFSVGKGQGLLCPPTARGGCTFCPSDHMEMGCSDNGIAHTSIDAAADFGAGFLPLLGEHGGQFPQQDLGFFVTEETIRRCHEGRKVPTLLEAGQRHFFFFSRS